MAGGGGAPAASGGGEALFAGAMPKEEIGALRFLQSNPSYDGRGVVVAIFDTGVDPGAPGLQVTSDGRPKIIDVIDCTGSGDVDTSTIVKADDDGLIAGASGRKLRPNPQWTNPTGEWRVGSKRLYELAPRPLVTRLKEERKKRFEEAQRAALAAASAAVAAANGKNGSGTNAAGPPDGEGASPGGGKAAAGPGKAELEARVACLQELMKSYEDPGPSVDAVVWHDGATWRAALDTSELFAPWEPPPSSPPPPAAAAAAAAAPTIDAAAAAGGGGGGGVAERAGKSEETGEEGEGALAKHPAFADFRLERQWGTFSALDACNYALNIYDGGNTLSVVVDSGAHGTHVAGIAAACFPEDPSSNGVAPGAQIISCKIGDTRLGSMETGTALTRAAAAVVSHGAHLINMSFGEPTAAAGAGRVIEVVTELVERHNCIFVASAGNAGPALSTVGAPGGTSSALISVGAFVSPALAAAGHSLRALGEITGGGGQQYTWSSRGPAADGYVGVVLSAPGGAIAPVPQWTTQRRQLMNGTSMASPNACGGIALLLSALLAEGQAVSPARVRRALENTCSPLGDARGDGVLTYGRGMLQVDKAFEYMQRSADADGPGARYAVSVATGGPPGLPEPRGIYLREPHESLAPRSFTVSVKPTLHEDAPTADKLAIEDEIVLTSTAPWVSCPDRLLLHHNGRTFEVKVDPSRLPQGLHYAEVQGTCARTPWRGPLFRLPITAIRPRRLAEAPAPAPPAAAATAAGAAAAPGVTPPPDGESSAGALSAATGGALSGPEGGAQQGSVSFDGWAEGDGGGAGGGGAQPSAGGDGGPSAGAGAAGAHPPPYTLRLGPLALSAGTELREFVAVPAGATWAEATFKGGEYDTPKMFLVRAAQLAPATRYTSSEWRTNLTLAPTSEYSANFRVIGGSTLELTVAQFWSSLGAASLEVEISFHGIQVDGSLGGHHGAPGAELAFTGAAGADRFTIISPLRRQRVKPEAKLRSVCTPLRPSEWALEPLEKPGTLAGCVSRDTLPAGRVVYRLLLTYKLNVTEAGKYTPTVPLLNDTLYESPLESQMLMLFDANKRLVYTGDAYPESVQLPKGDYTLRLALRHDSLELLEKLKGTCLVVERSIDPAVSVPVYTSHAAAVSAGAAASEVFLGAGERMALWLGAPPEDKLPKDGKEGRVLKGHLTLGQLRRGSGAAPAKHSVRFVAPPTINKDAGSGGKKKDDSADGGGADKDAEAKVAEGLRDAKLALMKDMRGEKDAATYDALAQEIRAAYPDHLPLLLELLRRADALPKDKGAARLDAIISAADDVVAAIDTTALAAFLALRAPDDAADAPAGSPAAEAAAAHKAQKKKMDEAKAALLEALSKKLEAQLDAADAAEPGEASEKAAAAALATSAALRQWVDTGADAAYVLLHSRVEARAGRLVGALKALEKSEKNAEDDGKAPRKEAAEQRIALLQRLGWGHWATLERARLRARFPAAFPPI